MRISVFLWPLAISVFFLLSCVSSPSEKFPERQTLPTKTRSTESLAPLDSEESEERETDDTQFEYPVYKDLYDKARRLDPFEQEKSGYQE